MSPWLRTLALILAAARFSLGQVNVALGKAAYQKSVFQDAYPALFAVDGNTIQLPHGGGTCSITNAGAPQWWLVDLAQRYHLNSLVIYTRSDLQPEQMSHVTMGTGLSFVQNQFDPQTYRTCATYPQVPTLGDVLTFECLAIGQFVTIYHQTTNYLNLCEVQLFGEPIKPTWKVTANSRHEGATLDGSGLMSRCSAILCAARCQQLPEDCVAFNIGRVGGDVNACTCQLISTQALPLVAGNLQADVHFKFYTSEY